MSKYKYLLWDIDDTILDFKAAEKTAIQSLFEKYQLGICTDEMLHRYSLINKRYWQALERGEMSKEAILTGRFKEFFSSEGLDDSIALDFNNDYQLTLGDTIIFHDDAKNILLDMKKRYKLVAVTNGTAVAQEKKLVNSGLSDIMDAVFISEKVGYEKPNSAFFTAVFDELRITDLSEVLIIGDSLSSDIQGGVHAGIDTCWYNPGNTPNTSDLNPTYIISDLHELTDIL